MRVLIVCTGNICRSPVIEAVLGERLPELTVASAGTRARHGDPLHALTSAALRPLGVDTAAHASRLLDESAVRGVDLVLTAEREHRSSVLALRPELLRRTFTFLEFVELAEQAAPRLPGRLVAQAVELTVAARGRHPVAAEDLPDPVDGGPPAHACTVATVLGAVDRLTSALLLSHDSGREQSDDRVTGIGGRA